MIAPATTSLALLHDLATQLLRAAKRARALAARERPDPHRGGYCDFLVLPARGCPRRAWPTGAPPRAGASRGEAPSYASSRRPTPGPKSKGCWQQRARSRGCPAAAGWAGLLALLPRGEAAASVDYLYYRTRTTEPVRAALRSLEEAWRGRGGRADVAPPWRGLPPGPERRDRRETVLADILTLVDCYAAAPARSADAAP